MSSISKDQLQLVKNLYYLNELPMKKVAETLGVSLDAVTYYMRHNNLKRRTRKEDSILRFKNKPLSFEINKKLSTYEEKLKVIGVTLYWGEGYKTKKSAGVDLANSDVSMILIFLSFLRKVCGVDENRLRVLLYCHSNQDTRQLVHFWSKKTKIPVTQFSKPYVRKNVHYDSIHTMPYGLVHIRYADKKLLQVIMDWIEEYKVM